MAFNRSSTLGLYWKQLCALLRKSLIIRKVHFISTFFELISPLLMIFVFAYIYSVNYSPGSGNGGNKNETLGPVIYANPQDRVYFSPSLDFRQYNDRKYTVVYAPDDDVTKSLLETFRIGNFPWMRLVGNATEAEMDAQLVLETKGLDQYDVPYDRLIGIYFHNSNDTDALKKGKISYKLRLPADELLMAYTGSQFPTKFNQGPVQNTNHLYYYNKFMKVQSYLNRVFVKQTCIANGGTNCEDLFRDTITKEAKEIYINRMPYPKYKNPNVNDFSMLDIVAVCLPLSFVLVCPLIVKRITDEKSSKAKELLRLIGMSDFVFYLSHFINYMGLILIHTLLITIIVFVFSTPLYSASSPVVFALGFFLWGAQLILFSMFITTIFNRPVIATIVMTILWIVLLSIIFAALVPSINTNLNVASTNPARAWTSLLPAGSIIWFLSIMGTLENNGVGLHFSNLNSHTTAYGGFTALHVLLITIGSYFVYGFLIWYLDNVWPFQHGVPKSPWYLFLPSYWRPKEKFHYSGKSKPEEDAQKFETEPSDLNAAIRVENVYKVFNRATTGKKVAVNELWLNIYENQITVLLGHNGAGKTTTMNMITGMYGSTSGSIFVNGYNVFTQTKQARRSIGLCPQENIIFNELTVAQHLRLFAALKDYPSDRIEGEVTNILALLKLLDKENVLATYLSGGMKRKLSLGIALVGETETLILDEPTSGMDPDARRVIWDLLLNIRRQRTILLTTHYMEEADVLGDRIAIMNEGKLCCSGTPFFLKNSFGTGYRLRIAKHDGFSSLDFEKVLRRYVPSASLNTEIETEVVYTLDDAEMDKKTLLSLMPQMFDDIEKNKRAYGVDSCGLSYATLEDVFISVGSDVNLNSSPEHADFATNGNGIENSKVLLSNSSEMKRGTELILNQLLGLFLKRFHFARRYLPMMIFQILIPALIIILAMYLQKAISAITKVKSAHLDMNVKQIYGPNTQTFVYGLNNFKDSYTKLNEDKYSAIVSSVNNTSTVVDDLTVDNWILDKIGNNIDNYIQKYLYGFGETESTFKNWINYEQLHSLPLSINVMFESILRSVLPESLRPEASILVESEPMLMPSRAANLDLIGIFISWALTCLIFMPIAFPFLAASYILYPIKENASKAKLIQLMTGLSPVTFWLANFLFDLLNHLIAITILYLVIFLLDSNHIFSGEGSNGSGGVLYLLLFSFGVSTIPVVYFMSYKFEKPSSGFVFLIIIFFFAGFIGNIIMSVLDTLMHNFFQPMPSVSSFWYPFLLFFLRFMPIFSMLFGYQKVQKLSMFSKLCASTPNITVACAGINPDSQNFMRGCCPDVCGDMCYQTANPFAMTQYGAGFEVLYMIITGLVCFLIIVLYETYKQEFTKYFSISQWIQMMRRSRSEEQVPINPRLQLNFSAEDSDVQKERLRIENEVTQSRSNLSDLLVVDNLSKKFGNFSAVEQLTFGVHYNECFGLLGVNGAGKTTTFSMLTGDLLPSSGNAYIQRGEFGLIENLQHFQGNIGYCPQFDALLDKITGEETLYLFARLRGIPNHFLQRDVNNLIKMVGLEAHAKKRTDTYSGGNRRKLSIAIALIGNPPLLFLDEPSAGVDPAARRKIWQTLGYLKRNFNSSIVLTSHSMEECEALCSRIGIMVNGRFRCLGSTQHLRSKYGQGYSVTISLRKKHESNQEYVNSIQQEVSRVLPSSALKDYHQSLMHYHITDPSERWSNIFQQMSSLNDRFDFEDYFVSDTTLEQIFIMFARHPKVETSTVL